ncbi:EpsG family protein, partial [uncultured Muribaculum sp.]
MLLYIIPFVLTILSSIKYDINRKNDIWEKYGLLFLFVYLILLIGLRYEVGGDTINYMGDYDWRVPLSQYKLSFNDKFQPGYIILCSLGKSISPDFYVFQLIHSALLNTLLFLFIKNNTKYVYTSLGIIFLTCYFYFSTEILRESIAVLIFSLNYKNLINRRWLSYYTGVLLCFMFHLSAIFLVI